MEDISVEELAELMCTTFVANSAEKHLKMMPLMRVFALGLKALTPEDPRVETLVRIRGRLGELNLSNPADEVELHEILMKLIPELTTLGFEKVGHSSLRMLAKERPRRIASLKSIQAFEDLLHKAKVDSGVDDPGMCCRELYDSWLGQALRKAKESGNAELFKILLRYLLENIGLFGLIAPTPARDAPGRPAGGAQKRQKLYDRWVELHHCPTPELAQVAYEEVYGEQFISNPKNGEQRERQRCQLRRCDLALAREKAAVAREFKVMAEEFEAMVDKSKAEDESFLK
jgi:hypothetical protein